MRIILIIFLTLFSCEVKDPYKWSAKIEFTLAECDRDQIDYVIFLLNQSGLQGTVAFHQKKIFSQEHKFGLLFTKDKKVNFDTLISNLGRKMSAEGIYIYDIKLYTKDGVIGY